MKNKTFGQQNNNNKAAMFTLFFSKFLNEQSLAITNDAYFYKHVLQGCSILTKFKIAK